MAATYRTRTPSARLSSGRKRIPRVRVYELQRARLIAGMIATVADVGYPNATVGSVIARARVSRKTFYDVFDDREDCFLAAFEQTLSDLRGLVTVAYQEQSGWRKGVRAGLASLLGFMDEEPSLARLCMVDALLAGPAVTERRVEVLDELAAAIERGRTAPRRGYDPPDLTAEGVVGAIFAVLHMRLIDERPQGPFTDLAPALTSMIVLPYLGEGAAREELAAPAPPQRHRDQAPAEPSDGIGPLKDLNIRLTYRTVRVLMAIAESPGASNREVSESSGVIDQGQISKLLTRLAGLGLIENRGAGQAHGAANAWHLTRRGAQLERATRPH
jgi:AcrR family transcriptional regulator